MCPRTGEVFFFFPFGLTPQVWWDTPSPEPQEVLPSAAFICPPDILNAILTQLSQLPLGFLLRRLLTAQRLGTILEGPWEGSLSCGFLFSTRLSSFPSGLWEGCARILGLSSSEFED